MVDHVLPHVRVLDEPVGRDVMKRTSVALIVLSRDEQDGAPYALDGDGCCGESFGHGQARCERGLEGDRLAGGHGAFQLRGHDIG